MKNCQKKDKLSDDENKKLIELSRSLVTVRDGKLGEWIGYAPLFNSGESLDLNKNIESNIADYGLGQMGKIMLDFQWNSMRASQGWAKLSLPMYDQPLWKNNGSFFINDKCHNKGTQHHEWGSKEQTQHQIDARLHLIDVTGQTCNKR